MARIMQVVNSRECAEWCQAFCLSGAVFVWIVAFTILAGCAQGAPIDPEAISLDSVVSTASAAAPWQAPEAWGSRARTIFSPDPELREATQLALDALNFAGGLRLTIADGGVPIHTAAKIPSDVPMRADECGHTQLTLSSGDHYAWIGIAAESASCGWPLDRVVMHEIIHTIRRNEFTGSADSCAHATSGVFAPSEGDVPLLNRDSLRMLCEYTHCRSWNPED